jgi:hypothetical protein
MTPTPEEFKAWLTERLRGHHGWPSGLSLSVEQMPADQVPKMEVRWVGDGPGMSPSESIGLRLRFAMHRSTRELTQRAMPQVRQSLQDVLAPPSFILEGRADLELVGQESELEEEPERRVFSWSVPVILEVAA